MKNLSLADNCITIWIYLIVLAEAGHLLMVFGNRPFSDSFYLFVAGLVFCLLTAVAYCVKSVRGRKAAGDGRRKAVGGGRRKATGVTILFAAAALTFVLFSLFQIMTIMSGDVTDRGGDMTMETVESILETGKAYDINPLTGRAYTEGIPKRIKVLGLPTLYACMCRLTGLGVWDFLTKWVPVAVLLCGYAVYGGLAQALFPRSEDRDKRMVFLAAVAAVLSIFGYRYGMDGYGLLYCGYRATTIRNMLLVPYTLLLCLQHRWMRALLCVAAEACIMWTLYGLGVCIAVLCAMGVIWLWMLRRGAGIHLVGKEG